MKLTRTDKLNRVYRPYVEQGRGIAMTNRALIADSEKWSAREHVADEVAAATKLRAGWHLWMEREDGTSERPSLITSTSIQGWR